MNAKSFASVLLIISICTASRADIVYTLNEPALFDSSPYGFGFAGTITTDGTTGLLTTLDFIENWAITVYTPSTVDGITSELFTPSNSSVTLFLSASPGLLVTPESISLAAGDSLATLSWASLSGDTSLTFSNRSPIGGGAGVRDLSEPEFGLGVSMLGAPIATAAPIPEPGAMVLFGLCSLACCVYHRRRGPGVSAVN